MRKLILIIFWSNFCIGQNKTPLLSDKYDGDRLTEFSVFDSTNNWFNLYHLSHHGDTMMIERFDTDGFTFIDTSFGYHQNGALAFYRIYKDGMHHGNFEVFDTSGNTVFSGQYYKGFRIGSWQAFNSTGKTVEKTEYYFNLRDSAFISKNIDSLTSAEMLKKYLVSDTIRFFYFVTDTRNEYGYSLQGHYGLQITQGSIAFVKSFKRRKKNSTGFLRQLYDSGIKGS